MRTISAHALAKLKEWEGLRLDAYLDSVGVPTIGYGSTGNAKLGDHITEAEAERRLMADVVPAQGVVSRLVALPLSDNEYGALVCFVFNVGVSAFTGSTLLKVLKQGDKALVPAQLMRWTKGKDPKTGQMIELPGLVNRRRLECELWSEP